MKEVYTLEDLESRELLDAGAIKPGRLAVIGHPIAHSASPKMHQAALDALGMDIRYIRIDIEPGQVGKAFFRMRALGFIGCNVTVPHKLEAMEHCEASPEAKLLGAVNTIRFDGARVEGFNTDGPGFALAIADAFGLSLKLLEVAILGAGGGAGQAIATQCGLLGARKLVLVNRTLGKLGPLAETLLSIAPELEIVCVDFADPMLSKLILECSLIVNTSSVGLKAGDASILPAASIQTGHMVYDTIYQPPVTPLLALAEAAGCRTANGRSMLIRQGALAFQHWFPGTEPLPMMAGALRKE